MRVETKITHEGVKIMVRRTLGAWITRRDLEAYPYFLLDPMRAIDRLALERATPLVWASMPTHDPEVVA